MTAVTSCTPDAVLAQSANPTTNVWEAPTARALPLIRRYAYGLEVTAPEDDMVVGVRCQVASFPTPGQINSVQVHIKPGVQVRLRLPAAE